MTGTADFGIVPAGAESAVSEIRVDATDFTGRQTLLTADSVTGLTEARVVVTVPKSKTAKVVVSGTSVTVTVAPSATVFVIR